MALPTTLHLKFYAKKVTVMKLISGLWAAFCKLNVRKKSVVLLIYFFTILRYTLLVGHPPFETQSLKDTYSKIKKNEFHVPSRIGPLARTLIIKMLQAEPSSRSVELLLTFIYCHVH